MSASPVASNQILAQLSGPDLAALVAAGDQVSLTPGDVLHRFGDPTTHYMFPLTGVVSLTVPTPGGHNVEVALAGREAIVGVSRLLGSEHRDLQAIAQVRGDAIQVEVGAVGDELRSSLRRIADRYLSSLLIEVAQTAACNRIHTVGERTARWLLHAVDRARTNDLQLTHEFLAMMLAVRRASVTVVVGQFERAGLIHSSRARISITDRQGLSEYACECYEVIRDAAPRYD